MGKGIDDRQVVTIKEVESDRIFDEKYTITEEIELFDDKGAPFDPPEYEYKKKDQYKHTVNITYKLLDANDQILLDLDTGNIILKKRIHETPPSDAEMTTDEAKQIIAGLEPQWFKDDWKALTDEDI